MARCTRCQKYHRVHRTFRERLLYRAIYECTVCKFRIVEWRAYTFRFSRYARCPDCGSQNLRRLRKRDPIERVSHHPWNVLQRMLGGRLYYCSRCRLQFGDLRPVAAPPTTDNGSLREVHP